MTPQEFEPRKAMLHHAADLITGDRNQTYGSPTQNFADTAHFWSIQLKHKLKDGVSLAPSDVAKLMISLKLCRMIAAEKDDNWVDIAGYAGCGYEAAGHGQKSAAPQDNVQLCAGDVLTTEGIISAGLTLSSITHPLYSELTHGAPEPPRNTVWRDVEGDVWHWYGYQYGWQIDIGETGDGTSWETIPEIYFPMVRVK